MKAPLAATVAYALRATGIELDVLLLDGGGHAEPAKEVRASSACL